jgi:hypothetical protein
MWLPLLHAMREKGGANMETLTYIVEVKILWFQIKIVRSSSTKNHSNDR